MRALITGASSGIGRDMARVLSKKGYELVLVARDEESLKKLQSELKTKTKIVSMDLTKTENCKNLYEQEKDIDLLINNAGFGDCGYFDETELDKDLAMIDTNIKAYHILMKLYLKDMVEKNSGKILNVASIAGFMPGPLMATYYATKAYIVRISESIRQELKKKNSKVQISILCKICNKKSRARRILYRSWSRRKNSKILWTYSTRHITCKNMLQSTTKKNKKIV